MSKNSYINYQNMVGSVTQSITKLDNVCRHMSMNSQADELNKISKKLNEHVFSVGIMGEFKRGKSTVINALLGQNIVPTDIVPCSATLNYVRWDTDKRAVINFKDGKNVTVPVEDLTNYVTKVTTESAKTAENVNNAVVYYPCAFCQNGVQIVDTPGLNDDERMNEISERVIPTLDAIIMVITVDSPFSQSEADFVRNKVMTSDLGRIIFLVNKIDYIDEEDRPRLLESIRDKIKSSVLEKTELVYGKDSPEYNATKDKIGIFRLIPVSARDALKGKTRNKPEMLAESGYPEFEEALSHLLTEERGMLELLHPVNQLLSVAAESAKAIQMRADSLRLDANEYKKIQEESMNKIKDTRDKKKQEIKTLRKKGKTLYSDLLPEVSPLYDEIKDSLYSYVQELSISEDDLTSEASRQEFSDKLSRDFNYEMECLLNIQIERLYNKVQNQLGQDVDELKEFGVEFNATMDQIQTDIQTSATVSNDDSGFSSTIISGVVDGVANVALATFTNGVIPGIGGIISGYREHGVKGAVVGGLAGAGVGYVTLVGLAAAGVVGFPLAIAGGLIASFGGRAITHLIWGKKNKPAPQKATVDVEKVKESIYDSVDDNIMQMRDSATIEKWLKKTCDETYNKMADDIDREWENTLVAMEENLSQIKIDLQQSEDNRKKTEKDLEEYSNEIKSVVEMITPISNKLNAALNQGA